MTEPEHINFNRRGVDIRTTECQVGAVFEAVPMVPEGQERVVLVDVDGTLMQLSPGCPTPDPASAGQLQAYLQVNVPVARRLQVLQARGFTLEAWTGRARALRAVTELQLAQAGLDGVLIHDQDAWRGLDALYNHKRGVAERRQAVFAVGDMRVDLDSAMDAGTPFMWVSDFAEAQDLHHMFCMPCGCTALRACVNRCSWVTPYTCSNCRTIIAIDGRRDD